MAFDVPILFLVFNRPDTTRQVFERIKEIQPAKLFIAADGPRSGKEGEKERCEEVRSLILKGIDWPCAVKTLFRDSNLGCGLAVNGAITWFFENVAEGIILEDDTLPDPSFFIFCKTLLEKYRSDDKIKMISGNNFQNGKWRGKGSYYFSAYSHIWGWATWKRVWEEYDYTLSRQNETSLASTMDYYFTEQKIKDHWTGVFRKAKEGKFNTWDLQFLFGIWDKKGVTIIPNKNLVTNIGFGDGATHTANKNDRLSGIKLSSMEKIFHPLIKDINKTADTYTFKKYFINRNTRLLNLFSKIKKRFNI